MKRITHPTKRWIIDVRIETVDGVSRWQVTEGFDVLGEGTCTTEVAARRAAGAALIRAIESGRLESD